MGRLRFFFKWSFVFFVLSIWTFFVTHGIISGSALESSNFNIPLYIQTNSGTTRASSTDIIDFLFNHNFDIQKKKEIIPMKDCSMRASDGAVKLEGRDIGQRSKITFNINHLSNGGGSFTSKKGRDYFILDFKTKKIKKTDAQRLIIEVEGDGRLNRDKIHFDSVVITFDRINNKVSLTADNEKYFKAMDMNVDFIEGCLVEEKTFFLIKDKGELKKSRTIAEVRQLLKQHPEMIDAFERLRRLFNDFWWLSLPPGIPIIS